MSEQKRFGEWEDVSCNECARYWDSSCDGVKEGTKKVCHCFVASRQVTIPAKLEALEKRVKWIELALGIGFIIIGTIVILLGCF